MFDTTGEEVSEMEESDSVNWSEWSLADLTEERAIWRLLADAHTGYSADHIPRNGTTFVNWWNPSEFKTLIDTLKAEYRQGGLQAMVNATFKAARDVIKMKAADMMLLEGQDPEEADIREAMGQLKAEGLDIRPREVVGTAIHTISTPTGSRNAFFQGAVAELLYEEGLKRHFSGDKEIISSSEMEKMDSDLHEFAGATPETQERKGIDVRILDKTGATPTVETVQVKATTSKPSGGAKVGADKLVWLDSNGRDGPFRERFLSEPKEV